MFKGSAGIFHKTLGLWLAVYSFASVFFLPVPSAAQTPDGFIVGETVWKGIVELKDDVVVAESGKLTVLPGTKIIVRSSDGTRTDPHFYSTETEIVVRGKLIAGGPAMAGVEFIHTGDGDWAGIIVDGHEARADFEGVTISGAQSGIMVIDGSVNLNRSTIRSCQYGLTLLGQARAGIRSSRLTENDYGLADFAGGAVLEDSAVSGNIEGNILDRYLIAEKEVMPWYRIPYRFDRRPGETEYLGEHSIEADTDWRGRVIIRGQVVVQPQATLTIAPGTEVSFRKVDSNGDGLGESQILILGKIKVQGTPENWILFTSAEEEKKAGDWDKVSLIASESTDNIVRFARFEYGYQAFHNHFSSVSMTGVMFNDNYRGVQFQESPKTTIEGAYFRGNKSAMRFRDSEVELSGCLVEKNVTGVNFLRCRADIRDSVIDDNLFDPLLGRESDTRINNLIVSANGEGPRFKGENSKLTMTSTAIHHNLQDGLSLLDVEADIGDTEISFNGLDGLSVTGGKVRINESNIIGNGRWAVDNNGSAEIEARGLFWGASDAQKIEEAIYDNGDDPSVGKVLFQPFSDSPLIRLFPGLAPQLGQWSGKVIVTGDCLLPVGSDFTILPGASVYFSALSAFSPFDLFREHPHFHGSEVIINEGSFSAIGRPDQPITFDAAAGATPGISGWGGININKAEKSRFSYCVFQKAETALHISESKADVSHNYFHGSDVGLRFHSSDIVVKGNVFDGNRIGLRFHFGEPAIEGNLFRDNRTAIFISQNPGGGRITGNDFMASTDYHMNLGEPVDKDIEAPDNYWGTTSERAIEEKIYDARDWEHLGRVRYLPFSPSPKANDVWIPAIP